MAKTTPQHWQFATFLLSGFIMGYFMAQANPAALFGNSADSEENAKVIEVQVGADGGGVVQVPEEQEEEPSIIQVSADDDAVLGDLNAPIEIIEFSDYQCSYCQRFHLETFDDLVTNYVDTGKVKFVYRDYPLSFHAQAPLASVSAYC
ncbi:thioredoxin domain-containing protein, partial [Candidatus Peregrinibacteria bacterium]|nr:thioredoxin domain-containing protein [Candidatus Peregrinibacteria bacterium]